MANNTKRNRFFDKTLVLIHEKGFKATTMRDIAQNLKFEVANVYNYIDSKQSFLEELLFGIQQEFLLAMDTIERSEYDAREKLELIIGSYIQITSERPYEQALLVNEWRNLKEAKLQEFVKRRTDYERQLENIIQDGKEIGQFRDLDTEITSKMILATLRWSYQKFLDKSVQNDPLVIKKQLIDFICHGIIRN
ncbi:MAG: AcrR family transcriptional regulator [Maribacter sp.]|jgi:AcrR family transcriptional regulator